METIRIAGLVKQSIVDGPGLRMVVFTQGCPHNCPGCHNPQAQSFDGGRDIPVDEILLEFTKNPLLKGITLSGGEPFARPDELIPLAKAARERGKDVFCYSGYTFEELLAKNDAATNELLLCIDILVDGPFILAQRNLQLRFRGSENQRILDVPASLLQRKAVLADLQ